MFFQFELKKIFRLYPFWIMILMFIVFNIFWIINVCDFTGEGIRVINSYVQLGMTSLEEEKDLCENFDNAKENAVADYYDTLDIKALVSQVKTIAVDKYSELFNQWIAKVYDKVERRIEEIKSDGEAEQEYYVGTTFHLHSTLYGSILRVVLLECVFSAILVSAYIIHYEEISHTYQNVYSSKRGRRIWFSKELAGIVATIIASIVIIGVTLFTFFHTVPQLWDFLQSSVSSAMATETRSFLTYPFITWIKMSQLQYLLAVVGMMIVYIILASLITFVIAFVCKNAFINVVCTVLLYLSFFTVGVGFANQTIFSIIQLFNPTMAMFNISGWFMEFVLNPQMSYPGYEIAVAVVYMVLSLLFIAFLWKRFKKKDIG